MVGYWRWKVYRRKRSKCSTAVRAVIWRSWGKCGVASGCVWGGIGGGGRACEARLVKGVGGSRGEGVVYIQGEIRPSWGRASG